MKIVSNVYKLETLPNLTQELQLQLLPLKSILNVTVVYLIFNAIYTHTTLLYTYTLYIYLYIYIYFSIHLQKQTQKPTYIQCQVGLLLLDYPNYKKRNALLTKSNKISK